jgi:hypothetical protein
VRLNRQGTAIRARLLGQGVPVAGSLILGGLLCVPSTQAAVRPAGPPLLLQSRPDERLTGPHQPAWVRRSSEELLLIWTSDLFDPSGAHKVAGIFGQRYDESLDEIGSRFLISPEPEVASDFDDVFPFGASTADGGFVVVWQGNDGQDGDFKGAFGQRFDSTASPAGTAFQANTTTEYYQLDPHVAAGADGGFVVAWSDYSYSGVADIFMQDFSQTGARVGAETHVAEMPVVPGQGRGAVTVASKDGHVVAVWDELPPPDSTSSDGIEVYARVLSGDPPPPSFQVNVATTGLQFHGDVVVRSDGSFIVSWADRPGTPDTTDARLRLFEADATPIEAVVPLGSAQQVADRPLLAVAPDDSTFVAVWTIGPRRSDGVGIVGQLFSPSGEPIGSPFTVVPTEESTDVSHPAVAYTDETHLVVAWMREFIPLSHSTPSVIEGQRYEIGFLGPTCGDANSSGFYEAADALVVLRTALDLAECDACICDLDGSGTVVATDALLVLKRAVGQAATLQCPACASAQAQSE